MLEQFSAGDSYDPEVVGTDLWTSGIHLRRGNHHHGNAIECHAISEEKANAMRDKVLVLLTPGGVDQRERFEQAAYAHYLQRHATGKTTDVNDPVSTREQLLWRDEQGNYGVLMFNAAWWAWQEAVKL